MGAARMFSEPAEVDFERESTHVGNSWTSSLSSTLLHFQGVRVSSQTIAINSRSLARTIAGLDKGGGDAG